MTAAAWHGKGGTLVGPTLAVKDNTAAEDRYMVYAATIDGDTDVAVADAAGPFLGRYIRIAVDRGLSVAFDGGAAIPVGGSGRLKAKLATSVVHFTGVTAPTAVEMTVTGRARRAA